MEGNSPRIRTSSTENPSKITVQRTHTNLWLQILLFLNVYFSPVWIVSSVYFYWSQQFIVTPVEEILTISAITVGIPVEISRLYFGYSGNLREQVKELMSSNSCLMKLWRYV
ncbi:Transmembrane protein [Pseudolycoriella hygida]|uniref:Transmembrane protein n=1 Tax=Pseudolycoriella hygida TaxID=35572 RepID=A0A9Q0MNC8_9DIPT|nr:Transmembrane protein [Pseudolycoriella hygida]